VSLAGSGVALEDDGVSDPRLIEQPEAASASTAIEIGTRRRDAPDQRWATGMTIDTKYSRTNNKLIGSATRRKIQPPKTKTRARGPR
jgi:hypothetical protein